MKRLLEFLKNHRNLFIALVSVLLLFAFSVTKAGQTAEYSFYDTLLHLKPAPKERNEILLLNIDDLAIEQVGSWPWSRDIIGNALLRLREFGGKTAVFDIEYLSPGQSGINRDYVETEFPKQYQSVQSNIDEYIAQFSSAISKKNIPVEEAANVGDIMREDLGKELSDLNEHIQSNIFRDNDAYLGETVRFFGNTFLTINAVDVNVNTENADLKQFAYDTMLYTNVTDTADLIKKETRATRAKEEEVYGISPTIMPILKYAAGAGFPNVIIDDDGVRRRIRLLNEYNDRYIAQLVFSPILHILQPENIIRKKNKLILTNCTHPDFKNKIDMTIPLDAQGNILINWLKKKFLDTENPANSSFKNLSIYSLIYADDIEKNIIDNLHNIFDLKIQTATGYLQYHAAVNYLLDSYESILQHKAQLLAAEANDYDDYFAQRAAFYDDLKTFLEGDFESEIHELFASVKEESGSTEYDKFDDYVASVFKAARDNYTIYADNEKTAREKCNNSFAIIGYSGVGTSDLGVNPFWASYPNVGTHANIYNTIMNRQFITPFPFFVSLIAAILFVFLTSLLLSHLKKVSVKLISGIAIVAGVFVFSIILFATLGWYVQTLMPALSIALCFLAITLFDFVFAEKEKSFLRKAFGVYLSKNVVDEIVKDPSKLALGGQEKRMTALFTDIRSFSTLSEKISPTHLVKVLNEYLTIMSDLIFDENGTVDKYIGDAIVSFFGAPVDLPDHASCACRTAVKMKLAEAELNERLYTTGDIPMPINTRIGINTGQMVVGNMGTDTKMNYTIMGNDVNLAARLEGVNKMYGTWILTSEATWNDTNGAFLGRRLDRVRVVGINTPVQLYNVMGERVSATDKQLELVSVFESGIDKYRDRDYKGALQIFEKVLQLDGNDGPAQAFIKKLQPLIADPELAKTHDDVVNMTTK